MLKYNYVAQLKS